MTDATTAPVQVDLRHLAPEADIPALTRITNDALTADRIQELFFGLFDGKTQDKHGWLEPL